MNIKSGAGQSNPRNEAPRNTARTNFARMDSDASDDIIDDNGPLSPPSKLGKRGRSTRPEEDPSARRKPPPVCLSRKSMLLTF